LACRDAGAEKSACHAPASHRAEAQPDGAQSVTVVVPHTPDVVQFAEQSFCELALRADAVSLALHELEPRLRLARQLRRRPNHWLL
jgi:hypothetical protein